MVMPPNCLDLSRKQVVIEDSFMKALFTKEWAEFRDSPWDSEASWRWQWQGLRYNCAGPPGAKSGEAVHPARPAIVEKGLPGNHGLEERNTTAHPRT